MSLKKMSSVYLDEDVRAVLQEEARSQRRGLSAVVQLRVLHSLMVEPGPLQSDVVAKLMQAKSAHQIGGTGSSDEGEGK